MSTSPLPSPSSHWCAPELQACLCADNGELKRPVDVSADVAMRDWADLLTAVKGRLSRIAGSGPSLPVAPNRVRDGVLECVAALDQLQLTLGNELGRHQQLELEIFDARTALAQARADLVGTRASELQARHLASHDALTSLPNRHRLREQLARAVAEVTAEQPALAVLFIDLDGFKQVNDHHGHDAGDQLLKIIAARLSRAVRAEDVVGRLGGDEFGVLIAGLPSREPLRQVACKLLSAVADPVLIGTLRLNVRASIGIATCPADGAGPDMLLRRADAAMYVAKRSHAGYAFYGESGAANAV